MFILYIDKALNENQMKYVEKHLDECPLCREALEGIREAGTDHYARGMEELRSRLHSGWPVKQRKNRSLLITTLSVAASVAIVAGVLYFYHQAQSMKVNAVAKTSQDSEVVAAPYDKEEIREPQNEIARPGPLKRERKITAKSKATDIHSDVASESGQQTVADLNSDSFVLKQEYKPAGNYVVSPSADETTLLSDNEKAVSAENPPIPASAGAKRSAPKEKRLISNAVRDEADKSEIQMNNVMMQTDKMPVFKGGDLNTFVDYMQKVVSDSVQFQTGDINKNLIISFVVDTLGRPVDISMMNSNNREVNNEIIRLFRNSPNWTPGIKKGAKTSVKYTINLQVGK